MSAFGVSVVAGSSFVVSAFGASSVVAGSSFVMSAFGASVVASSEVLASFVTSTCSGMSLL